MIIRADLLVIKEASPSLRTGIDLKRSLTDLFTILKNAIHGDVGSIVVNNGGSLAVISEGFSTKEK